MARTDEGIHIDERLKHCANAESGIDESEEPDSNVTVNRPEHVSKQWRPIP
jgi:hypothetical protein